MPAFEEVKKLLTARRLGHDANQLLVDIMEVWGGTDRFAADLYAEYKDPRATPFIRQNILEMIQKLVVNNTNHNITRIERPDGLDDDEIDERIQAAVQRAVEFERERERRAQAETLYPAPPSEPAPD